MDGLAPIDFDIAQIDLGMADFTLDLAAFNIDGTSDDSNRYVKPRLAKRPRATAVKYDRAEDLVKDLGAGILAGERADVLASGNFIFGDFFEALAVTHDVHIEDLTLSTLSISQDNVDSLKNLIDGGYLGSLNIIVSDYFWSHNRSNAKYIYDALDVDDKFQLAVAGTHTKIALMLIDDKKIIIHGSANMRSSRSVEVFTVETNPDLYDFHMEWHRAILDQYATIKKSVRATKLFDGITKGVWT